MPAERELTSHLFRRESGRIVAALVRAFGPWHVDLAEDCVQEAFIRALERWPFEGIPPNPPAWLTTVARNRAIDRLRRDRSLLAEVPDAAFDGPRDETADQLALISLCCHPKLTEESRIALTLKTACGFSIGEIARALLAAESAVAQRIVRAKRQIREEGLSAEVADVESVLRVLYLLFNEGYSASGGDELIRADLCEEAIRIALLVADHRTTACAEADALVALMLFQAARFAARVDDGGALNLLAEQDRSRWDQAMIARGVQRLMRSARGTRITTYHLQAEIASLHIQGETNWHRLAELFDDLMAMEPTPVVALNRAVAIARAHGAAAGIRAMEALKDEPALREYHLLPAVLGQLWREAGDLARAAEFEAKALKLAKNGAERKFLERRIVLDSSANGGLK